MSATYTASLVLRTTLRIKPTILPENEVTCPTCARKIEEGVNFCPTDGTKIVIVPQELKGIKVSIVEISKILNEHDGTLSILDADKFGTDGEEGLDTLEGYYSIGDEVSLSNFDGESVTLTMPIASMDVGEGEDDVVIQDELLSDHWKEFRDLAMRIDDRGFVKSHTPVELVLMDNSGY